MADALTVGLALAVVMTCFAAAFNRAFLADMARKGEKIERSMNAYVYVEPPERVAAVVEDDDEEDWADDEHEGVVLPPERRTRAE